MADFLDWYNKINGTRFIVAAEPEPPEAVARYRDDYIWLEVADVFQSDEYARDLYSFATSSETHKPMGPGPFMNMDEKFAQRFVSVLNAKLAKASYKPFYELYGPGILLLAMHTPWFNETTMELIGSQYKAADWSGNLEFFGEVFIAFFSSDGRTFRKWQAVSSPSTPEASV